MKQKRMLWAVPVLAAFVWLTACEPVNKLVPQTQVSATLSGQSVRPAGAGASATGSFSGIIDPNTQLLTYTMTYSASLVPTAAYMYRITNVADSSGVADLPLLSSFTSGKIITSPVSATTNTPIVGPTTGVGSATLTPPFSGTLLLTRAKIDSIKSGYYYIAVSTDTYPNGAIRGRVRAQ